MNMSGICPYSATDMNLTFPFLIHCPQRLAVLRDECRGGEDKTNRLHGHKLVRQMLEGRQGEPVRRHRDNGVRREEPGDIIPKSTTHVVDRLRHSAGNLLVQRWDMMRTPGRKAKGKLPKGELLDHFYHSH